MHPSSPTDWLDPQGDPTPVLDPEAHMLEMAARRGHNKDVVCPQVVVGGFIDLMTAPMVKATRAVDSNVHPHLKLGTLRDCPIGVATIPVGAARAVAVLEELIALGPRTILIAGATGSLQLRASNLQPVARSLQSAAASSGACSSPAPRSPLLSGVAQGVGAAPAAAPFPLTCLYLNNCSLSLQHTLEGGATPTPRGLKTFRE